MATTNHERVGKALDLLKTGLGPFVDREMQGAIKTQRVDVAALRRFVDDPQIGSRRVPEKDIAVLLKLDVGDVERRVPRDPRAGRAWLRW